MFRVLLTFIFGLEFWTWHLLEFQKNMLNPRFFQAGIFLHMKYDQTVKKIFYLLIENINVVIAANNAGFVIADVFVTHDLSHLVKRELI